MKIGRDAEKFLVRLPDGLREQIKATADENLRSMNSEIVFRLAQSYQSQMKKADAAA